VAGHAAGPACVCAIAIKRPSMLTVASHLWEGILTGTGFLANVTHGRRGAP
jgi:hypothetical protein